MKKCVTLLVILLCNFIAFSQVDLIVSVKNNSNFKPVSAINVLLENKEIGYKKIQLTDGNGKTTFASLSIAGSYAVSIESSYYIADAVENFQLRTNENPSVQLTARAKQTQDLAVAKVFSGSSKINTINAEVSAQLKRKELELLPIEGRDITRSLYRLPNVTQATGFYPEAPNVSINGANALFTSYLVDGMDNNERFLGGQKFAMPLGFTQNATVLSNNYSVEFGNTANGIINLTTRSGSNKTTGEVFYLTRPGAVVDASSKYFQKDLSGNNVKDGFQRQQFGAAIGGAIKKDKTFYYINAEQTIDIKDNLLTSPQLGINGTVRGYNYFSYLSGKIDQRWSDHFKSSLRINAGIVNIARQGGGLEGGVAFPSAGNKQDRNSLLIAFQNIYTKGRISNETNIQYSNFRWNYARPTNANNPQVEVKAPDGATVAVFGHPGYAFDAHESTIQVQEKIKLFLKKHTLKAGAEVIAARHQLYGGGVPNGYYQVKLTASELAALKAKNKGIALDYTDIPLSVAVPFYSVELRPAQFGKTQTITSFYAEDLFAVNNKLNITYGVRYDYDNLSKGGSNKGDYNNIAPRASFNYTLNDRSSIRGGSGIAYDKVLYSVYSDALQQNTTSPEYKLQLQALIDKGILPKSTNLNAITFDGNLSAGATNVPYLNGPAAASLQNQRNSVFSFERRILNPAGYKNSYAWQNTIGYQYQVNDKLLLYTDVVYDRGYNLFRLIDLNAPTAYQIPANGATPRSSAAANLTRPVPIFTDGTGNYGIINGQKIYGVARNVTVTDAGGKSEYIGLNVNAKKDKANDKYAYFLSYTLSRLKNNTDDINFRASDANNYANEWGPSLNDRTHVISGVFYYYPFKQLSVSFASLIQSGQPVNRIPDGTLYGTTDLNGDGGSFGDAYVGNSDRQPGESRNSDRLPWSKVFDAGIQFNVPLKRSGTIEIRADIFNVFNTVNLSGYSNNATQSNQIQTGPKGSGIIGKNAGAPRQFQFGARYAF